MRGLALYGLAAAITASVLLGAFAVWQASARRDQVKTALIALCLQREDLDRNISNTETLLRMEKGPVIFGIPRTVLLNNLKARKQFRQNLSILECR